MKFTSGKYDDIINRPHHVSVKRPKMSMEARAGQFAPFAALTGHKEAIDDTAVDHVDEWNQSSGEGLSRGEFEDI